MATVKVPVLCNSQTTLSALPHITLIRILTLYMPQIGHLFIKPSSFLSLMNSCLAQRQQSRENTVISEVYCVVTNVHVVTARFLWSTMTLAAKAAVARWKNAGKEFFIATLFFIAHLTNSFSPWASTLCSAASLESQWVNMLEISPIVWSAQLHVSVPQGKRMIGWHLEGKYPVKCHKSCIQAHQRRRHRLLKMHWLNSSRKGNATLGNSLWLTVFTQNTF